MWICNMNLYTVFPCYLKAEHSYEIFHKLKWRTNYLRTHLANGCTGQMEIKHSQLVQSLSCVHSLWPPRTAPHQASLFTNSWTLLKLMSIESVMPSNISSSVGPFSSRLQSFPASGSFQRSQFFASGGFSSGPSNDYSGLISFRWTGWISLQSKGLSRVFSNTAVHNRSEFIHWILTQDLSLPVHSLISTCAYLGCSLWLFIHTYKSASVHL